MIRVDYNFVYVTVAELLPHVQNCDPTGLLDHLGQN